MVVLGVERLRVRRGTRKAPTISEMFCTLSCVFVILFCILFVHLKYSMMVFFNLSCGKMHRYKMYHLFKKIYHLNHF